MSVSMDVKTQNIYSERRESISEWVYMYKKWQKMMGTIYGGRINQVNNVAGN